MKDRSFDQLGCVDKESKMTTNEIQTHAHNNQRLPKIRLHTSNPCIVDVC